MEGCVGDDCEVDPKCEDDITIDKWVKSKQMIIKVINNQVNLEHHELYEDYFTQNEIQFPTVPLEKGKFSDTGYRYRFNQVYIKESINPFQDYGEMNFYDIKQYNTDTFNLNEEHAKQTKDIAKMYFRIDTEQIVNNR